MSERAQAEAAEFKRSADELILICEGMTREEWQSACPGEGWSFGVVAHHVAEGNRLLIERLSQPVGGLTPEELVLINARSAAALPRPDQEETLIVLREMLDEALAEIRLHDDERLAHRLNRHTRGHLESISAGLASVRGSGSGGKEG